MPTSHNVGRRPALRTIVCVAPGCRANTSWLDEAPGADPESGMRRVGSTGLPEGWRPADAPGEGPSFGQLHGLCKQHGGDER